MNDVLGIDIGYGYTKTYKSMIGQNRFPTRLAVASAGNGSFGDSRQRITVNGDTFFVGYDAEGEIIGTIGTQTTSFVGSNAWLAILGKALFINRLVPEDMEGFRLVFGLPPGLFSAEKEQWLAEIIKSAKIGVVTKDKAILPYDLSRTNVTLIPQGAGIYFAYLVSAADANKEKLKNIAVVDIGHHTIDTVLFSHGKYIAGVASSRPMGVSILLDRLRTMFAQEHDQFISQEAALKLLTEKKLSSFQEDYTMKGAEKLLSDYATQVSSHIDSFFGGLGDVVADMGIAAGGGISLVQNHLRVKNRILVMSNPDMANAMGYWGYGMNRQ